jgi:hypothetical protein
VTILRDAGVLLGEPDAGTTYEILQVLLDGQLDHRLSGLDVRIGFVESFLRREDDVPTAGLDGRYESVFALARYGLQSSAGKQEIVGTGSATYRVLAEDTDYTPWTVEAEVVWRRFLYGDAWDPIGALEFAASAGASDLGEPDGATDFDTANFAEGRVGWTWSPARATRYRLASSLRLESGEVVLAVTFDGVWAWLDAGYVGGAAIPAAFP